MKDPEVTSKHLLGWTILGLRGVDDQAALQHSVRQTGAMYLALPALHLLPSANVESARSSLVDALACPACVFTSPAAVRFGSQLQPLRDATCLAIAVGSGTAAALRRAGVHDALAPRIEMRSEGVLALAALTPPPSRVGIITAPGGRGEIARVLALRGASVIVAEVYERSAATLSQRTKSALLELQSPTAVLVSSSEALNSVHRQLNDHERATWLRSVAVCASQRLLTQALALGFSHVIECGSTQPKRQLEALGIYAKDRGFR